MAVKKFKKAGCVDRPLPCAGRKACAAVCGVLHLWLACFVPRRHLF